MNRYQVHFNPPEFDSTSIEVIAESCSDAVQGAIDIAKDASSEYNPELFTRLTVSRIWKDIETHWLIYSWGGGHWQAENRIPKDSINLACKDLSPDRWQETITTIAGKLGTSIDEAEILARLDELLLVEESVKANGIFFGCSGDDR